MAMFALPHRRRVPCVQLMEALHALAGMVAGAEVPTEEEQKMQEYLRPCLPKVKIWDERSCVEHPDAFKRISQISF